MKTVMNSAKFGKLPDKNCVINKVENVLKVSKKKSNIALAIVISIPRRQKSIYQKPQIVLREAQ